MFNLQTSAFFLLVARSKRERPLHNMQRLSFSELDKPTVDKATVKSTARKHIRNLKSTL